MPQQVIDTASPVPPYQQLAVHIKGMIADGKMPPSAKLPSVRTMARQFNLSHTTVNKVLHELKSSGLLVSRQGAGVFVAPSPHVVPQAPAAELWVQAIILVGEERRRLLAQFERECPGCRLIESPEGDDLAWIEQSFLPRSAGALVDMTAKAREVYGRSASQTDLLAPLCVEGRLPMLPMSLNAQIMACNLDVFERAGVPLPAEDWTWDDFLRTCALLRSAAPEVAPAVIYPHWDYVLPVIWQSGGAVFSPDGRRCLIDHAPALRAASFLREAGRLCRPAWSTDHAEIYRRFIAGGVGLATVGAWGYCQLNEGGARWRGVPLPRAEASVTWTSARGYGLSRRSVHHREAMRFIELRAAQETWPDKVGRRCGLPLHSSLELDGPTERCFRRAFMTGRPWLSDIDPERRRPRHMTALNAIVRHVPALLHGSQPPIDVLRAVREEVDALISPSGTPHDR